MSRLRSGPWTDDARRSRPEPVDHATHSDRDPLGETAMSNETAISIAGLTKHYPGVQALTDLTLDVPAGEIYGFLGPNGAGKSTTLKILGGLIRPTAGTAAVVGTPLTDGAAYRQQV